MSRLPPVLAAVLVISLAACARPDAAAAPEAPATPDAQRYRTVGIVIDGPERGPELCYAMLLTNPPECGGVPIDGWSWDGIAHEDLRGTQHGTYEVVGTYDGERFTMTEAPRPGTMRNITPRPDFSSPCPVPPGGWAPQNRATTTENTFNAARAYAAKAKGYAGAWIETLSDDDRTMNDPRHFVFNVRFTGDLAAHERELREIYGGALCVTRAERTHAELEDIAREVAARTGSTESRASEVTGKVEAVVYVVDPAWQAEFDEAYGPGVVSVYGRFEPVS